MSSRYTVILVLYALAVFGAVLVFSEGCLWLLRARILRAIERRRPTDALMIHAVLRLLPIAIAFIFTARSAIPSYVNGEPLSTREMPGLWLTGLGAVGLYSVLTPLLRAVGILVRTAAKTKGWARRESGRESFADFPVIEVNLDVPMIAASGLLRKSIFVSRGAKNLLSPRELRAALRHEAAHCRHNHNAARLFIAITPQLLPLPDFEESLLETLEYVADDDACRVPGDALNLASALLVMARRAVPQRALLYSTLIGTSETARLERRIQRLVLPHEQLGGGLFTYLTASWIFLVATAATVGSLAPAQHAFREMLELMVR